MRLTLRTLLAHLDKTLEAADDMAIAAKLRESEFASTLVKRIAACMASDRLDAPSPVSTSTADDPNRIGEYLDSVLSSEQVAEIERICLESDMHLAEVAACHQVLTIVLGNLAEVPPALRTRIYDLATSKDAGATSGPGASAGTVRRASSLSAADDGGDAISRAMAADMAAAGDATVRGKTIEPVGPDDSGVSDAPTRLREFPGAKSAARSAPAMAGSRPLDVAEASEIFGRSSRVMPWLVSLALAAAFLFVVVQAFKPLLQDPSRIDDDAVALQDSNAPAPSSDGGLVTPKPTDPTATDAPPEPRDADAAVTPPMVDVDPGTVVSPLPPPGDNAAVAPVDGGETETLPMPSLPVPATEEPEAAVEVDSESEPAAAPGDSERMPAVVEVKPDAIEPPSTEEPIPSADPTKDVVAAAESKTVASIVGEDSLVLRQMAGGGPFVLTTKDEPIADGSTVICPPLYRDRLRIFDKVDLTMVGPATVGLGVDQGDKVNASLLNGRFLLGPRSNAAVTPSDEDVQVGAPEFEELTVRILFGESQHELTFPTADALAAIEIVSFRNPGADPEEEGQTTQFIAVLSVQGELQWKTDGAESTTIQTGEVLRWSKGITATKVPVATVPEWIEEPKAVPGSIEKSARDGLLALVRGNESIELSLREAIDFRKAEVGALAAQTLVLLDRPDVYFGADGILADVKQKAFWPEHFAALVSAIDRGPQSAAVVREAINQMDAAEASAIYRLLWLFSNPQLEAGGDELLVTSLDSPNMTVRVLAAENLRRITGTTLFFKPENNTAPRRSSDIKKWETRLKKQDIRWTDAAVEPAAKPATPKSEAPKPEAS